MKNFLECICVVWESLWILFTDKGEQRQLDYDNGGGEIE